MGAIMMHTYFELIGDAPYLISKSLLDEIKLPEVTGDREVGGIISIYGRSFELRSFDEMTQAFHVYPVETGV